MSMTFTFFAENIALIGVNHFHYGLIEFEQFCDTVGLHFSGSEGKAIRGQRVVASEMEVALSIFLLHDYFITRGVINIRTLKVSV